MAIALALIVAIAVVDIGIGTSVHLGPLLVIAPTLTASFAGPRLTAVVGALAEAALLIIAIFHGGLTTTNHVAQLIALAVLSALVVFVCYVRERHARELSRLRSVAEMAQRAFQASSPDALLQEIHRDLLVHTCEQLTDDAAFLIIERTPSRHPHRPHLVSQADGSPSF
ncbi:hypothetical protein ABT133_19705 [Streptomyces sp. NPDC001835]|uniref:hypothetical protein n=1 Tax=Streptomyces sp. NPDC001835 TaxID=3154528 RepID=UPI003332CF6B